MDINANLREQRQLTKLLLSDDVTNFVPRAMRLAELVQSLDQWILSGGFLPDGWQRAQNRNK